MSSTAAALRFAVHFLRSYLTALPRVVYRTTVSCLFDPRGSQRFIHDVLGAQDLLADAPVLGSADMPGLIPGSEETFLRGSLHLPYAGGTSALLELGCIAYAVKRTGARRVFEIGTFRGRTTRVLALNAPKDAEILTLDLPQGEVGHTVGELFRDTPEAGRITQLSGDSWSFDFSPWAGSCDFVWIDGCHERRYVARDTENAQAMCRPGGWIGWHDYRHTAWWSGVTGHVRKIRDAFPVIRHLRGTTVVLARVGD